jgi:hypothetical protein
VHGTLHFGKAWPNNVSSGVEYDFGDPSVNPADGFHTYAIEWQEGEIRWYVDDVHYATQTMDGWWSHYQDEEGNWVSGPDDAPYNQKFHLILNVAMGGSWPASVNDTGIDATIEQAEMQVDYVRVYQCRLDPETGAGCTNGTSAEAVAENGVTEPDFPSEVDLSSSILSLFDSGSLLEGFQLNGWDDAGNDSRSITENMIDISIVDNGNAYIEKLGDPLDMSDFVGGEMTFDLSVIGGGASALSVKMDSGYPNLASIDINAADLPAVDDWTSYRFPISDFIAAGTNAFSIASISNPIVFEPVNNADLHFQVNNIHFYKPITLSDSQSVIDGFTLDGYTSDAADTRAVDENGVIDLQFSGTGNAFLTAEPALDMSNYADWAMKFDLKLVDPGTNTDILVKMDSGWPNVSDLTLSSTTTGLPADSDWHSYQIPVADFIAADNTLSPGSKCDITNVTNPIVLEGSDGENLHVQIKNIRFEAN